MAPILLVLWSFRFVVVENLRAQGLNPPAMQVHKRHVLAAGHHAIDDVLQTWEGAEANSDASKAFLLCPSTMEHERLAGARLRGQLFVKGLQPGRGSCFSQDSCSNGSHNSA